MKRYESLLIALVVLVLGAGLQTARCDPPAPLQIVSHEDGDDVCLGGQILLRAVGGVPPLNWSGPGLFSPATGNEVLWTAPVSGTTATVTVSDQAAQYDSVTFDLIRVIFVDKDRPGGDGSSWINAFKCLQDGLNAATSGMEIWVAEGTYKPDEDAANPNGTGNQYTRFTLKNGVAIYGGFVGNEAEREARNWIAHPTILSGDVDEDGILSGANCEHVVYGLLVDATAILDGFTVTMGYAELQDADGGGITLISCYPKIANCVIQQNKADTDDGDGGGMHCLGAYPTVTNCIFIGNIAGDDGGALCNKNGSSGMFTNCAFYGNQTLGIEDSHGGAIFNTRGEEDNYVGSSPTFINCVIAGNLTRQTGGSGGDGGGAADQDSGSNVTWVNCTFYGNTAQDDGGGLATRDGGHSTVTNCIFWDDSAGGNGPELWQGGTPDGTATVTYSDVEGGWAGNINSDPKFFSSADLDGADNRFLTADDGLKVDLGSPCIDTATSAGAPAFDATGRTRPIDGDGNGTLYYDMGAYEAVQLVEKAPYLIYPGQTATPYFAAQMTVLWQLVETRTCTLEWGTTTNYGTSVQTTEINTGAWGHQHRYTITGLTPATTYYYRVQGVGTGSFRTAPTPAATSTSFLVYSDTQGSNGSPAVFYDPVCAKMLGSPQTFVLHCGDHVDHGNSEVAWKEEYFARLKPHAMALLANYPILGCVGNHDVRDSDGTYRAESYYGTLLFNKYWPYPFMGPENTSYWSFDYGPVHVVVLDQYATGTYSGDNKIGAAQRGWLDLNLATTNRPWKVVIFHEAGFAGLETPTSAGQEVRGDLQAIFETRHVDLVFAGHKHYYCHSALGTVKHVTTGGAGGTLESYTAAPWHVAPLPTSNGVKHHFCQVSINGNILTLDAIDASGMVIDHFTIQH